MPVYVNTAARSGMKAQLALCMKYMPAACMKSLTLTHEGWGFGFAKSQFIGLIAQTSGLVCALDIKIRPIARNGAEERIGLAKL